VEKNVLYSHYFLFHKNIAICNPTFFIKTLTPSILVGFYIQILPSSAFSSQGVLVCRGMRCSTPVAREKACIYWSSDPACHM
jgi:hypothetical protein